MPRSTDLTKFAQKPFSGEKAKAFFDNAIREWEYRHRKDQRNEFVKKEVAKEIERIEGIRIAESTLGQILNGKRLASLYQCLPIAHALEVPIEDLLRAEGYPDVHDLYEWAKAHPVTAERAMQLGGTTEDAQKIQEYILGMLDAALTHPYWKQTDWHNSVYRQQADEALVAEIPMGDKALRYADAVHDWALHFKENQSRFSRKTDEVLALVSNAS